MNDAAAQQNRVEELLKVADMGPDFEPTVLGNLKPPPPPAHVATVSASCQADSNSSGISVFPGPGGSLELRAWNSADNVAPGSEGFEDRLPPADLESEVLHTKVDVENQLLSRSGSLADNDDGTFSDSVSTCNSSRSEETATAFRGGNSHTGKSEVTSGFADSACDNRDAVTAEFIAAENDASVASRPTESETVFRGGNSNCSGKWETRTDICGVDHSLLWQQVLHTKRKSVNRWYSPSGELANRFEVASNSTRTYAWRGRRAKMKKADKIGRGCRNANFLLSCHYHNSDVQD